MPERTTRVSIGLPSITASGAYRATRIVLVSIPHDDRDKAIGGPHKQEREPVTGTRVAMFDVPVPDKASRVDLIATCVGEGDTVPVPLMATIRMDNLDAGRLATTRGSVPIVLPEPGFIDLMPAEPSRAAKRAQAKAAQPARIAAGDRVKTPDGDGKVVEIRPGEPGSDGRPMAVLIVSVGGKMRQYAPDKVSIMQAAS